MIWFYHVKNLLFVKRNKKNFVCSFLTFFSFFCDLTFALIKLNIKKRENTFLFKIISCLLKERHITKANNKTNGDQLI